MLDGVRRAGTDIADIQDLYGTYGARDDHDRGRAGISSVLSGGV